jgi:hypothetical protein
MNLKFAWKCLKQVWNVRSRLGSYFILQSLQKVLPRTTLYFVLLSWHKVLPSITLYYFVLQSLHKALPKTTSYYKASQRYFPVCPEINLKWHWKDFERSPKQAWKLLRTNYKAWTKYFPVLLCTGKLAQGTFQYYFIHTSSYYKASQRYLLVWHESEMNLKWMLWPWNEFEMSLKRAWKLLRATKLAQSTSQYYFVLQNKSTFQSQYYFVLQGLHKPALLCTTKLALHTSHSPLNTSHSPLQNSHSPIHTPHFTLHTSNSPLHISHSTLHTTLHTAHSKLYTPRFTLHTCHTCHTKSRFATSKRNVLYQFHPIPIGTARGRLETSDTQRAEKKASTTPRPRTKKQ